MICNYEYNSRFKKLADEWKPGEEVEYGRRKNENTENIGFIFCSIPKVPKTNVVVNPCASSKTVEDGRKDRAVLQNICEPGPSSCPVMAIRSEKIGVSPRKIIKNDVSTRTVTTNLVDLMKEDDKNNNKTSYPTVIKKEGRMKKYTRHFKIDVNDTDTLYGIILEYGISSTHSPFAHIFCKSLPKITIVPVHQKDQIEVGSLVRFSKMEYDMNMVKLKRGDVSKVGLTHIVNHRMYSGVEAKRKKFSVLLKNYEVVEHRESEECHEFDHPILGTVKDFLEKDIKNTVYRNMKLNLSRKGSIGFEVIDSTEYVIMLPEEVILRETMPEDPEEQEKHWKEINHWREVQKQQKKWEKVGALEVMEFGRYFGMDGVILEAFEPLMAKNAIDNCKQIKGYLSPIAADEDDDRMCENEFPNGVITPYREFDDDLLLFIPDEKSQDIELNLGELHKFIPKGRPQPVEFK